MQNENKIENKIITTIVMVLLILNTGIAQPISNSFIEKDENLLEKINKGGEEKGIVSYDVMQNIMQNDNAKQLQFDISVEREQRVIVEIFNEEGTLVEVIYNDFMLPNEKTKFWLSGKKWNIDLTYYLRVTSDDRIENHEIIFEEEY